MKAAFLVCALLIFSSSSFGHGVERGAVRAGISEADLAFLSEGSKEIISQLVEDRCNLDGVVSASAEISEDEESASSQTPNGFRIRLTLTLAQKTLPVIIIVQASETGLSSNGKEPVLEYSVHSAVCR